MVRLLKGLVFCFWQFFLPASYKKWFFQRYEGLDYQTVKMRGLEAELLILPHLLHKEAVFFDVGANIGEYTYFASKYTDRGNIFAFEPLSDLHQQLRRFFPESHIHRLALSDRNGHFQFKVPIIQGKKVLTRSTLNTDFKEKDEQEALLVDVQTIRLDDFVAAQNIQQVHVIKIDVEGHEEQMLNGAKATIQNQKPILIVEIAQQHHQEPIVNIITSIKGKTYNCYYFDEYLPGLRLLEIDPGTLQDQVNGRRPVYNFIFLPVEHFPPAKIEAINNKIR
jgi:FkbM family methyltransferase